MWGAAAHEGAPLALEILAAAADELARLARILAARAGPAPTAFVGGVLRLHPCIRAGIEAAVPGAAFPALDAALHAARTALRRAGAP